MSPTGVRQAWGSPNWQCVYYKADVQTTLAYEGLHIMKIGPTTRIESALCRIG